MIQRFAELLEVASTVAYPGFPVASATTGAAVRVGSGPVDDLG